MDVRCVVYVRKAVQLRLLAELHYTIHIKQTVTIFYLFMTTPLSNVFSVVF